MATLIASSRLLDSNLAVDPSGVSAVIWLFAAANAPADRPLLSNVLNGAGAALDSVSPFIGQAVPGIHDLTEQLHHAGRNLTPLDAAARELLMTGRWSRHRVWGVLSGLTMSSPTHILRLVGAELALSLLRGTTFRVKIARECERFLSEYEKPNEETETRCRRYADRLLIEVERLARSAGSPNAKWDFLLAARVAASLARQLTPHNMSDRTAAGTIREMTPFEVKRAMASLIEGVVAGDPLAIVVADAFFQGLPLDVALDVPFERTSQCDWVAVQDVQEGLIKIDLSAVLPSLAAPKPGHVPASQVLVRPYPALLAQAKQRLVSRFLGAGCLRDLLREKDIQSREPVPGLGTDSAITPSIARLLHSRGTTAMAAGIDRTLAAYLSCDFSKIGSAKHHYATIQRDELWTAAAQYFDYLGWGVPAGKDVNSALAMGSMVTPTMDLIKTVDNVLLERLSAIRIGKRYTVQSLLNHHNAYSVLCAHRFALFTSARRAATFRFTASGFLPNAAFASLVDKKVGPLDGATPIPTPGIVRDQLVLWRTHLDSLCQRLKKLGWSQDHPVFSRCRDIEALKSVPLFFALTVGGIRDLGSKDLLSALPDSVQINGDAFRHFIPNELRRMGLPSTLVDATVRHQVKRTTMASSTAAVVQLEWLSRVAQKLDEIAVRLGLFPVKGLSRGSRHAH